MKPPICAICFNRFSNGGSLIRFKETEDDKRSNQRFKQKDFIGHPKNAVWFCEEHIIFARQYTHFEKQEALKLIRAYIENQ